MTDDPHSPPPRLGQVSRPIGGLRPHQLLGLLGLFWTYVTLSNVLYAYGMRTGIAHRTNVPLFVEWDIRVLQHVLLLPVLCVSFWASLRVQWRPLWVALPLQITLGVLFAAVAYPAMLASQTVLGGADLHEHLMEFGVNSSPFFMNPGFLSLWLASFMSFLPSYGFGLALVHGLSIYMRFKESELRITALEQEWTSARLAALRMQLSPHTLFNLLHTIRGNIDWDPKAAQSMVVQLADLLRRLLNAGERDLTPLADEVEFVRLYLELQRRRFEDRLSVELPGAADLGAAWVPSLILQPLVENAVTHGLAGHAGAVRIRVAAELSHQTLKLRVRNTLAPDKLPGAPGIGIRNVRDRLAVQFEGRATLVVGPQDGEWVSEITMPRLLAAGPAATAPPAAESTRAHPGGRRVEA